MNKGLYYYILIVFFGCVFSTFAQQNVQASVEKKEIKIGGALEYIIKVQANEQSKIVFPQSDTLGKFEVIESMPVDTIRENEKITFVKKYLLTQFDSGTFVLPRQAVFINGKNHQTDLFSIKVQGVVVDTLKQPMYDIKENIGTSTDDFTIWYYIVGLVASLLLGVLSYFIIRKIQNKNLTEDDLFRTPLEKATKKLEELDQKKMIIQGNVKGYYSEITEIARDYIEEVFEIPAKEMTTSELISLLMNDIKTKKIKISKDVVNDLKKVLQTADLVKFAKSEPAYEQISEDRTTIEKISKNIDEAMPKFAEEQSQRVRLREQRYKRRKNIRTWMPIGISSVLMLAIAVFYTFTTFDFAWLQSNKKLYNKQWVESVYGSPALKIETPEALVRMPKTVKDKESDIAHFTYHNANTHLVIDVETSIIPKQEKEENLDVEEVYKHKLKVFEKTLNAKDTKTEVEKFEQESINGLRATGTFKAKMSVEDEEQEYQFETYIFVRENAVQEVHVFWKKGDTYGQKIASRVFESIQLNAME